MKIIEINNDLHRVLKLEAVHKGVTLKSLVELKLKADAINRVIESTEKKEECE